MNIKRYLIILLGAISALTGFARATDDKTLKRFYNFTPKEFNSQLNYYIEYNHIDSAMLCANIQASKYGKGNLTPQEIEACCVAFRYMGLQNLICFYNYQLAAENLLKAEQIANKYQFKSRAQIANDKAVLAAMQNDLENNFAFNRDVLESFVKASYLSIEIIKQHNTEIDRMALETTTLNPLYLALKFDKATEVTEVVKAYREAEQRQGACGNVAAVMCDAVDFYNAGDYDKALETLQTPLTHPKFLNDKDFIQMKYMLIVSQYAVLVKSGKRAEALNLMMQQEQSFREQGMTFELLEALWLIKQHYQADGNKAMADKYALQYYITKDEFINKSHAGKIDQAKLNLELEQTRERISDMRHHYQMQTVMLWSTIIIALLALALLGILWVNYRRTKRTNRLLYEKNIALLNEGKELRLTAKPTPVAEHANAPDQDRPSQADRDLMDKITAVLESSPEVYGEDFSRQRLAELVDSNVKYVSRAINACKQCNFYMLLNEYRIKEACRRLMDTEGYGSYSLEGIANSVGYKSRSNFAAVFKNIVGLTPSAFQKLCRKQGTAPTHPETVV
ncbi:MAG: helix-turn-helix transcriptional regulator [Muribaculaceae bacterium]|nr:helix-turn-helix transcriptional regulator [Muribaculaceae bacterium]